MTLTYVESDEHASLYTRRDGTKVHLAHGHVMTILVDLDTIDVHDLYAKWRQNNRYTQRHEQGEFLDYLRALVIEPDGVDDIAWCRDCVEPYNTDEDLYSTSNGDVCESCLSEYWHCDDCESYVCETTSTMQETEVCDYCRRSNWSFCDDCDGWYRDRDADDHHHNDECECESPAKTFTMRNDGEAALANDTRVIISLPAGTIDPEGLQRIRVLLASNGIFTACHILPQVGSLWQQREGNFTKRLSRMTYKHDGTKIPPDVLSAIGCIARDHSTPVDFAVEVTRDLNLSAEEFGNEDSCWWESYSEGRCALKSNGGMGMRTFDYRDDYRDDVSGRAWVMPLVKSEGSLTATFDTVTPDAFVVFNGYGDLSGYVPARILSHMAGWTYRKVEFSASPMFINGDSAYIVAPEEIADGYTDGRLRLSLSQHSALFTHESERALSHV